MDERVLDDEKVKEIIDNFNDSFKRMLMGDLFSISEAKEIIGTLVCYVAFYEGKCKVYDSMNKRRDVKC